MKKIKSIKKLTLRQEVIRTLTSAELKTVIGGMEAGGGGNTHSKAAVADGPPTTCE